MNISGIRGNHGFYSGQLHMGKAEEVSQDLATQAAEAIGESPVQGTANQSTVSEGDARSKQSFTSFSMIRIRLTRWLVRIVISAHLTWRRLFLLCRRIQYCSSTSSLLAARAHLAHPMDSTQLRTLIYKLI